MTTPAEIEAKFWKAIKFDRTLMLGLSGVDEGLGQPMTAQLDEDAERGPIYIFTAKDTDLVRSMGERHLATANFVARDHDLFAGVKLLLGSDPKQDYQEQGCSSPVDLDGMSSQYSDVKGRLAVG